MNNTDLLKCYELLERIAVDKIMLKEKLDSGNRSCAGTIKNLESIENEIGDLLCDMYILQENE